MESKGTAVVTGAAQGIGREIALRLARDGFDLALNDITAKRTELHGVEEEVVKLGRKAGLFIADVAAEDEVRAMLEAVVAKFGGIEVMVANAGICKGGAFLDVNVDDWDRTFSINVRGVFLCYQYAAKQMVAQGRGGRIIGACSLAGKQGKAARFRYSASKFAVRGLTGGSCLASELGAHGITVNAYAPAAQTPAGRNGKLSDVVGIVSFLASEEASFITGESFISVNGGRYFD
ncbi:hypothetical protein DFH09DRAFT_1409024 [Mycena vulgaris]|nr:hypothetical protein DFH09DRAFT_1409024 [Mycena vulgaris]